MDAKNLLSGMSAALKVRLGGRIPLRVTHVLTYRCNLNCEYCSRNSPGEELDTEGVKELMDSFASMGTKYWSFNGGEPLLRDDIGKLIAHAKKIGMTVSMATNGTLVPERIKEIAGVDIVTLSLDGEAETHDLIRCGTHANVEDAAKALQGIKKRFNFVTVVGSHNIGELDQILALAEREGAKVFFQPIRVQKEDLAGRSRMLFPSKEEMAQAMDKLMALKADGHPIASSAEYLEHVKKTWPDGPSSIKCWAGRFFCAVTPSGSVAHCCDTLAGATDEGAQAFSCLGEPACATCFPSIPQETNILMDSLMSPSYMVGQALREYVL